MKVLSIDPSYSNCGVVVWEDGLLYDYFVIQTSKASEEVVRLAHIIDILKKVIKEENIEEVIVEGLSFGSVSTSVRGLAGLFYSIQLLCHYSNIPFYEVPPTSVKKFATGSGRADKKDMKKALPDNIAEKFEKTHKTIVSGLYDLVDAYFIGKYYYEKIKGENYVE